MQPVPDSPCEFFEEYVPRHFAAMIEPTLPKTTSIGAVLTRVVDHGAWSYRLQGGGLVFSTGMTDDVIIQVTVEHKDFKPVFVHGAELQQSRGVLKEQAIVAFKALTAEAERIALIQNVAGSIAFIVDDNGVERRLIVTPGREEPELAAPQCRLHCSMADFMDMQLGTQSALQLVMNGKIRIAGNAQIAMVLSAVFT